MEGLLLYFFKNKKMLLKVSSAKLFLGRGVRRICGRVVESLSTGFHCLLPLSPSLPSQSPMTTRLLLSDE